jgi:hypothetical protein
MSIGSKVRVVPLERLVSKSKFPSSFNTGKYSIEPASVDFLEHSMNLPIDTSLDDEVRRMRMSAVMLDQLRHVSALSERKRRQQFRMKYFNISNPLHAAHIRVEVESDGNNGNRNQEGTVSVTKQLLAQLHEDRHWKVQSTKHQKLEATTTTGNSLVDGS